jgi:hypothetical protein
MRPTSIRGKTHCFSKPANWDDATMGPCGDLEVRVEVEPPPSNIVECVSAWKPDAEELAMLNRGGAVEIYVCAKAQPVLRVGAVEPFEEPKVERHITLNEHAHGFTEA